MYIPGPCLTSFYDILWYYGFPIADDQDFLRIINRKLKILLSFAKDFISTPSRDAIYKWFMEINWIRTQFTDLRYFSNFLINGLIILQTFRSSTRKYPFS